ncbi:hypothetical protein MHI39_13315 [Heyndrickxia sp. FSL K6-6286]|uniref:hypothetical protein n=1 Tax=Heyndrickxia sp. FSL K6-6286 TaxID=2921510 RepID=UPI00315AF18D
MKTVSKYCCVLFMILLLLNGCSSSQEKKKDAKNMNKVISKYIIDHNKNAYVETEKQFEVHKIYGKTEKKGMVDVYMYSLYEGYNHETMAKPQSGGSRPVFIRLQKDGEKYKVIDYKEPKSGESFVTSIKKMFPSEYAKTTIKDSDKAKDLQKMMEKKVNKWLSELKKVD